jgi:NifB/MoaA-like Fe-S oxidoreductase
VICGKSAELILQPLINNLDIPNLFIKLVAVENRFFGKDITVTGLLTGQDILHALNELQGNCSGVIIPGVALRSGEDVFLDNYSLNDLKKDLNINVQVANNGIELKNLLLNWLGTNVQTPSQNEVYTWQSNCAYSKNK